MDVRVDTPPRHGEDESVGRRRSENGASRRRRPPSSLKLLAEIAGVVACLVAIAAYIHDLGYPRPVDEPQHPSRHFTLTTPVDGSEVNFTVDAEAITTRPTWNNFFVVTTPSGADRIQDGPNPASPSGVMTGRIRLGTTAVGAGDVYVIRAFATMTTPSSDSQLPRDAIFSNAVRVRRGMPPDSRQVHDQEQRSPR